MRNPKDKADSKKLQLTQETVKALTVRTGCKTGLLLGVGGTVCCIKNSGPQTKGYCTQN